MIVHQRDHLLGGIFVFRCHVPIEQVFNIAKRYRMVAQAEPACVLFRKDEHEITETGLDDLLLVCINPVLIAHFCLGCGRGPKSIAVHLPYPLLLRTARLVGPLTVQRRVVWRQEDAARMPGRSFRSPCLLIGLFALAHVEMHIFLLLTGNTGRTYVDCQWIG